MELTLQQTDHMIEEGVNRNPEIKAIVSNPGYSSGLQDILLRSGVDVELQETIDFEVKLVLALYTPLNELVPNIVESTGLDIKIVENLVFLMENSILQPVFEKLKMFGNMWYLELEKEGSVPDANITLKEKLELRPEGVPQPPPAQNIPNETAPQPLTREDVISALAARRTMAGDIESIKNSQESEEK